MTKEDKAKLKEQINQLVKIKNKSKLVTALTHYCSDFGADNLQSKCDYASEFYEANIDNMHGSQTFINHILEKYLNGQLAVNLDTKEMIMQNGQIFIKDGGDITDQFSLENFEHKLEMMMLMVNSNGGTLHDLMTENDDNIVKRACKELGITYKELGEAVGYGEGAIKNSVSTGKISEPMQKAIELYLETVELKKQLKSTEILKQALKDLIK